MFTSTPLLAWLIFLAAAIFEVGGDAVIRQGLRGGRPMLLSLSCVMLAGYGVAVNLVPWDFSKLLGVYVAFFTLISLLASRFLWQEAIPASTWLGFLLIVAGSAIIQFADKA